MPDVKKYAVRYLAEPWDKPPENVSKKAIAPGIRPSLDNYGYCDVLFLASVLVDENGDFDSILVLSSEGKDGPSRKLLEGVRKSIDHYLEHHC